MRAEYELEWWRESFSTRFVATNLPRPGDPLYGRRFVLMEELVDGELKRVER